MKTLSLEELQVEFEDYISFSSCHPLEKKRQAQFYYQDDRTQELWQVYQECYLMMTRRNK